MSNPDKENNKSIVIGWLTALRNGDAEGLFAPLHQNVVFEIPGSAVIPFAGTFEGIAEVQRAFGIIAETLEFGVVGEIRVIAGEANMVFAKGHERSTTRPLGKVFDSEFLWAFTLVGDKILRFESYEDTEAIAAAYTP